MHGHVFLMLLAISPVKEYVAYVHKNQMDTFL